MSTSHPQRAPPFHRNRTSVPSPPSHGTAMTYRQRATHNFRNSYPTHTIRSSRMRSIVSSRTPPFYLIRGVSADAYRLAISVPHTAPPIKLLRDPALPYPNVRPTALVVSLEFSTTPSAPIATYLLPSPKAP